MSVARVGILSLVLLFSYAAPLLAIDPNVPIDEVGRLKAEVKMLQGKAGELKQVEAEKALLQERVKQLEEICRGAGIAVPQAQKVARPATQSADGNTYATGGLRQADANVPIRTMQLDIFLGRYSSVAGDYQKANTSAKKDEVIDKMVAAIRAEAEGLLLTLSGEVQDVKIGRDGTVTLAIGKMEELQRLQGKPVSAESAFETIDLSMTRDQAARIDKGNKLVFRGQPVFQAETGLRAKSHPGMSVFLTIPANSGLRSAAPAHVSVSPCFFSKYSCTIAGVTYESVGAPGATGSAAAARGGAGASAATRNAVTRPRDDD